MELNGSIGNKKVVTVSGSHKGVGKTAISQILLSHLPRFTAIKITMTGKDTGIYEDAGHLMVPGTDTFRMMQSGAEKVLWIRTTEDRIVYFIKDALGRVGDIRGILIEGNTILRHLNPSLSCFVTTASLDSMKPSRTNALKKADLCVLNERSGAITRDALYEKLKLINPSIALFSFNLLEQTGTNHREFNRFLRCVDERLG